MGASRGDRSSVDADGEVLGELEPIVEDHDQVHVELNLEVCMDVCGARVRVREEHVKGDLKVRQDVAVGDLNVLDLRGVRLFLKSLNAHQLDFN